MFHDILATFLTAMTPIGELRVAIPVAIAGFSVHPGIAYAVAVIGNIIPVLFLLWFWERGAKWVADLYPPFGKLFHWLFERTRKKFYENHRKFGDWALLIFVAIPLPITGAWTGSLAAWLFGIPYKRAVALIFGGVLISGIIVTALTLGVITVFN